MCKGILAFVWYIVSAAVTAEFPQGYNLPILFSAKGPGNFTVFFEVFANL